MIMIGVAEQCICDMNRFTSIDRCESHRLWRHIRKKGIEGGSKMPKFSLVPGKYLSGVTYTFQLLLFGRGTCVCNTTDENYYWCFVLAYI